MHPCLQIPELVADICSHLVTEKHGIPKHGDLVVLARSSKLFSRHALALVWKSVNLMDLLRLLPKDCFALKKSENPYGGLRIVMRPRQGRRLRDSDFGRIQLYAPYVQELELDARFRDATPMLPSAGGRLSEVLFPVLRGLTWTHAGKTYDVELIKYFLTPHLTELRIHSASLALLTSLSTLGSLCPELKDLHLSYPSGISLDEREEADFALSECLRGLHYIEKMTVDTLHVSAIHHLSGLPTLRELNFNDMSTWALPPLDEDEDKIAFPSLRKLSFSTGLIESPCLLLAFCRESPVAELSVELSGEYCTTEEMNLLFLGVASGIADSALNHFTFYHEPDFDTDAPLRPPVDRANHIITSDSLRDLFHFHNLVSVYILSGVGVELDDNTVFCMARSWPHIERLEFRSHHGTASPRTTLGCLKSFNQFCTKLTKLCIPLDARINVLPVVLTVWRCVTLESLKELDVEASPIADGHLESIARYFSHLFPRLKMLETLVDSLEGETEREGELIPEVLEYHPLWKKVGSIMKLHEEDEAAGKLE